MEYPDFRDEIVDKIEFLQRIGRPSNGLDASKRGDGVVGQHQAFKCSQALETANRLQAVA